MRIGMAHAHKARASVISYAAPWQMQPHDVMLLCAWNMRCVWDRRFVLSILHASGTDLILSRAFDQNEKKFVFNHITDQINIRISDQNLVGCRPGPRNRRAHIQILFFSLSLSPLCIAHKYKNLNVPHIVRCEYFLRGVDMHRDHCTHIFYIFCIDCVARDVTL